MAKKPKRARVDDLLVTRGLAPDLKRARALIMAGAVIVRERRVDKAGERIPENSAMRVKGRKAHPYVGRGGVKLAGALDHFGVDPSGYICLDLGASTGGFTDCLLQRGATRVYAVDVGYGLLDYRLQQDARVVNLERTHAADLDTTRVPEPIDLVVADISFNSLTHLIGASVPLMKPGALAVLLVKPQFELSPAEVGEGGIVRDPALRQRALERVSAAVKALGLKVLGVMDSTLAGTKGNVELLLYARKR